jgi:excisionase family DNA binding protein
LALNPRQRNRSWFDRRLYLGPLHRRLASTTGLGVSQNNLGICCTKGIVCHYSHSSSGKVAGTGGYLVRETSRKMAENSERGDVPPFSGAAGGPFLTVAEVATTLRVSKMSVYRLIHSGQLEAVRFNRSFRVSEKALDAYLQGAFYDVG